MQKKLLWLDDERSPYNEFWVYTMRNEYGLDLLSYEIYHAKTYNEFIKLLDEYVFDMICFDHDLGGEKDGYDACKYLIDYVVNNDIELPDYRIQSANPVGAENIRTYIENAKKHLEL